MAGRRNVQQAHERAQVALFLRWFNQRYRAHFEVSTEPNPPEAIIRSGRTTRWVEVSTAFWSDAYAHDEYSHATPGETHKPIGDGWFMDMDAQFSQRFVSVVKKKLEKHSYVATLKAYGPGYLVVPVFFPFFDEDTMVRMRREWATQEVNDLGCFRSVFITHPTGNETHVCRWEMT